ncbi:MAG: hypothetical protein WBD02_03635 [Acidimicrobiia bacterium]
MNNRLRLATYAFIPLFLFHQGDHIRRGLGMASTQLVILGTSGSYAAVATITLVLVKHRWAPLAAFVVGSATALGFAAVHWLPTWSVSSDSFTSHHVDWVSWSASIGEVTGAVLLSLAGIATMRSQAHVQERIDTA